MCLYLTVLAFLTSISIFETYLLTYIYFTLVFSTMLHLGLGLSRLTLASRVAQASAVTPATLMLNHGAALQQSLQGLHTAPKLDMRVSGGLTHHGCLMLICCQDQCFHLVGRLLP